MTTAKYVGLCRLAHLFTFLTIDAMLITLMMMLFCCCRYCCWDRK